MKRRLSASSQNQATNALVYLYRHVLADEVGVDHLGKFAAERFPRKRRVPTVLSVAEVQRLLDAIEHPTWRLMAEALYGTGLRVSECCTLRIRDVDFERGQIIVRGGKGDKDRVVMLPASLRTRLQEQVDRVRERHDLDVAVGGGHVPLPESLANKVKYAERDWRWQYLFPSAVLRRGTDDRGFRGRHDRGSWVRGWRRWWCSIGRGLSFSVGGREVAVLGRGRVEAGGLDQRACNGHTILRRKGLGRFARLERGPVARAPRRRPGRYRMRHRGAFSHGHHHQERTD